jgi:serine/threonine protein kinase
MEFCPQDGTRLISMEAGTESQLAAGLARRFRFVRRLGAGGMGTVYLAEQIGVGNRLVALKVLNRKLLDDPEFLLRFQNEAGSTGRIHHPNVVTIYEAAQAEDGTPYIAMEFLDGETLRDALKERGAFSLPECSDILQQTARGLNAAHKLGIIHRDLKPDNIFLTHGEGGELQIKVVDFGIAKLRESVTHTMTGMVLGTPAYMSSEQAAGIRSDQLDLRSDVYSLGIVVYEMLTGSLPFHSDTPLGYLRKHMLEPPPPLRTLESGLPVPPAVEAVVMKALAKDRTQRYASALDFATEFSRAVAALPAPEPLQTTRVIEPRDWRQAESPVQESARVELKTVPTPPPLPRVQPIIRQDTPAQPTNVEPPPLPRAKLETPPPVKQDVAPLAVRPPRPLEIPLPRKSSLAASKPDFSGQGSSGQRFFKIGFWIFGISQILLILENIVQTVRYRYLYHFQAMSMFGLMIEIAVGAGFVVIFCGFLARRRNTMLLWVSLGFAAMGLLANNVFWIAFVKEYDYHLAYNAISLLSVWRVFSISSGLPLSSLIGPFVMTHFGRLPYFAILVNLDCLLKIGFLIWAFFKYRDTPQTPTSST